MRPPRPRSLPLLAAALAGSTLAAGDLATCLEATEDRLGCARALLGDRPPRERELQALDPLIERDPRAALELFEGLAARSPEGDAGAALLDRQATALAALGRVDAAAERQLAAFRLDPGTVRVRWRPSDPDLPGDGGKVRVPSKSRPIEIDPGRRLIETVRRLQQAGRLDEARPLRERAQCLGAAGSLDDGSGEPPELLRAGPWYEPLPELSIRLAGGGSFRTSEARGHVLVLDFWASWCKPCLEELAGLRKLHEAERQRGLQAVLINVGEPLGTIERYAAALGLDMPIGLYDEALDRAFDTSALPTVIVADGRGRIRARFAGYEEGLEATIAGIVRALLDAGREEPLTDVAAVDHGRGLFDLGWMRDAPGAVEGLVVAALGAEPSIVVSGGREIAVYDRRGVVTDYWARPAGAGLLRSADLDDDGREELLAFRRGGTRVVRTAPGVEPTAFDAPGPLFDLEILAANGEDPAMELWLATLERLFRTAEDGSRPTAIEGVGTVIELERAGAAGVAMLANEGLCFIDPGAAPPALPACIPRDEAVGLLADGRGGLFELSAGVSAAAVGSFTERAAVELAVATESGRLLLVDAPSGEMVWRAAWPAVALAARDLDGDGLDELVVAAGRRIHLLQRRPPRASD